MVLPDILVRTPNETSTKEIKMLIVRRKIPSAKNGIHVINTVNEPSINWTSCYKIIGMIYIAMTDNSISLTGQSLTVFIKTYTMREIPHTGQKWSSMNRHIGVENNQSFTHLIGTNQSYITHIPLHVATKNICVHIADTLLHTEEDTKKVRTTDENRAHSKNSDKRRRRNGVTSRRP